MSPSSGRVCLSNGACLSSPLPFQDLQFQDNTQHVSSSCGSLCLLYRSFLGAQGSWQPLRGPWHPCLSCREVHTHCCSLFPLSPMSCWKRRFPSFVGSLPLKSTPTWNKGVKKEITLPLKSDLPGKSCSKEGRQDFRATWPWGRRKGC